MMKTANIIIGLFFIATGISAQDLIFQESIDLNSDNKPDSIKIEHIKGTFNQFRLKIGDIEILDQIEDGETDGFQVIDINENDNYKEISVHSQTPGYGNNYIIYWYNGEKIIKMITLFGNVTFLNNGILYLNSWEGFWTRRDKYLLNNVSRQFELIPQFAYFVGVKVKVETSFFIYKEKDLQDEVLLLSKGSEIELLLCDTKNSGYNDYVYLIKSESGLIGWARFKEIYDNSSGFQMAG